MSTRTGIEWTDATWNPVRGCSRVSPGCQNCYAERAAARFSDEKMIVRVKPYRSGAVREIPGPFHGFATQSPPRWTGKVALVEKHLLDPLRWRKPRRIFVNSMSDLFHESLPDEAIDRVFAVMALAPRHTFQILTKRAERMRDYFAAAGRREAIAAAGQAMAPYDYEDEEGAGDQRNWLDGVWVAGWPLPNVWLGVSCEDQARADERIPLLLQTPAAVRFVSAEPLLGGIALRPAWTRPQRGCDGKHRGRCGVGLHHHHDEFCGPRLDWVIVGGESGPDARPCDVAWVRSLVTQCRATALACFVKQLGSQPCSSHDDAAPPFPNAEPYGDKSVRLYPDGYGRVFYHGLRDRKGGDPAEWSADLRVRKFPGGDR